MAARAALLKGQRAHRRSATGAHETLPLPQEGLCRLCCSPHCSIASHDFSLLITPSCTALRHRVRLASLCGERSRCRKQLRSRLQCE